MTTQADLQKRITELEAELAQTKELGESARLQFKQSQQMLQLVLDTIPMRIFWKDKTLTYLGCNRFFAQDAGLAPEEIIGKNDLELSGAEYAENFRADDRQVMNTGTPKLNYEEPNITADGSKTWLRTNKIPLCDAEGHIIGILGTYDDITDQKQTEQERESLQREIIEAQQQAITELSTRLSRLWTASSSCPS